MILSCVRLFRTKIQRVYRARAKRSAFHDRGSLAVGHLNCGDYLDPLHKPKVHGTAHIAVSWKSLHSRQPSHLRHFSPSISPRDISLSPRYVHRPSELDILEKSRRSRIRDNDHPCTLHRTGKQNFYKKTSIQKIWMFFFFFSILGIKKVGSLCIS